MHGAVLRRLIQAALTVVGVVAICFSLVRLAPGDPFFTSLDGASASPEQRALQRERFGYDRPIPVQFARFAANVARGDLGLSHSRGQSVREAIASVLPASLLLVGTAMVLAFAAGVPLGAWQGWNPDTGSARASDRLGLVLLSIPDFVIALLFVIGPVVAWRWFPSGGMRTEFGPTGAAGTLDLLAHLVLPALALALPIGAVVARLQRAAMREVRDAEFVRAARARGAGPWRLATRHALRNSLGPVLAYAGVQLPAVLSGAILVERVFSWPGMGSMAVDAALARDYPLVVGCVLLGASGVVIGSLLADLARLWADPRQRVLP